MLTRTLLLVLVGLLLPLLAWAQGPPALTEIDHLRLQIVALQRALAQEQAESDGCRGALGPLRARANQAQIEQSEQAAIAAIEAAHPGYAFDRQTGALTPQPAPSSPPQQDPPDGK